MTNKYIMGPKIAKWDQQLHNRTDKERTNKIHQGCFSSCLLQSLFSFCQNLFFLFLTLPYSHLVEKGFDLI